MDNQISSNGRVARNAVMLSVRMLLIMVVGLYTSRVVLSTLGVKDYGIYGLVGGIVAMVSFLNAILLFIAFKDLNFSIQFVNFAASSTPAMSLLQEHPLRKAGSEDPVEYLLGLLPCRLRWKPACHVPVDTPGIGGFAQPAGKGVERIEIIARIEIMASQALHGSISLQSHFKE